MFKTMRRLGYRTNAIARSLKTLRTDVIGLIATDFTNPAMPELASGVEAAAAEKGFFVVFCSTHGDSDTETKCIDLLRQRRVEGLVIASVLDGSPIVHQLLEEGYPFVLAGRRIDAVEPYVGVDNRKGVAEAVDQLCELGHKSIAYISGDPRSSITAERMEGYKYGLSKNNLCYSPELIVEGDYSPQGGEIAVQQLLDRGYGFSAVLAANDRMAFGAWNCLARHGLQVPDDVSLIGFDDIESASLSPIKLSTVRQPLRELGYACGQLLLSLIGNDTPPRCKTIILQTQLVIRDTCAPPRQRIGSLNETSSESGVFDKP